MKPAVNFSTVCMYLFIITQLLLTGCIVTKQDLEGVHVGRPLVFSRESLIKDRNTELVWLESKLNTVPAQGIQGKRFTREFSSLTGSVALQADPTVIGKYKAQQESDLSNINRVDEFTGKVHESKLSEIDSQKALNDKKALYQLKSLEQTSNAMDVIIAELQEQINQKTLVRNAKCAAGPTAEGCQAANSEVAAAVGSLQNLLVKNGENPFAIAPTQYGYGIVEKKDSASGDINLVPIGGQELKKPKTELVTEAAVKSIQNAAEAIQATKQAMVAQGLNTDLVSGLSVTPIDNFEDELAYRTRVRDQISKTMLDDRHDTFGNTLYRLQFPITVIPREENPHWVKVEVELRPEATMFFPPLFFKEFHQKATQASTAFRKSLISSEESQNIEEAYQELKTFYSKKKDLLPHSISTWSDQWLSTIRNQIDLRFKDLLNRWENSGRSQLSSEELLSLDKLIGSICFKVNNIPVEEQKSFFYKQLNPHCSGNIFFQSASGDIRNIGDLQSALNLNPKGPDLLKLKHYAILMKAIADTKFSYNFAPYVDLKYSRIDFNPQAPTSSNLYLSWKDGTDPKFTDYGLYRLLADILTNYVADVYSVNPDESTQRIEDAAEMSKVFGLNLAAQFLLGSVGGEVALNYLKGKEKLLSTVLRRPVVLSLPGSTLESITTEQGYQPPGIKLGWLIGPVFRIKNDRKDVEFFQTPTKKTVSTDISIPATWTALNVKANVSYINNKNLNVMQSETKAIATSNSPLYLPAQKPHFESLFLATPRTAMFPDRPKGKLSLNVDSDLSLLITGENVWRTNAVSLGNTLTTDITVVGSMEGIRAKWPIVPLSACPSDKEINKNAGDSSCEVNIRLWSQHADSVVYKDNVSLIWHKPPQLEETYNLSKIIFDELAPLLVKFEDKETTIKVSGKNFPIVSSKWMVDYGEVKLSGNDIGVSQDGDRHQLEWKLDKAKVNTMFTACKNPSVINEQKICHKKFTIHYNNSPLPNGQFYYNIVQK